MTNYITKDQIREGDTIRVTFEESGGVSVVYTGTARAKDFEGDWRAYSDRYLTYRGDDLIDTIELLERPLPTEPGTVFSATQISGIACDVKVFVREGLFNGLNYVTSKLVGGDTSFTASHIEEWDALDR